jgi:hypothetical protein
MFRNRSVPLLGIAVTFAVYFYGSSWPEWTRVSIDLVAGASIVANLMATSTDADSRIG